MVHGGRLNGTLKLLPNEGRICYIADSNQFCILWGKMITTVQEQFLLALYDFHYLIIRHFQEHLGYSKGSYTTITSHLNSLSHDGFVETTSLRWTAHYGRPALVYLLARRGLNYLRDVHQL